MSEALEKLRALIKSTAPLTKGRRDLEEIEDAFASAIGREQAYKSALDRNNAKLEQLRSIIDEALAFADAAGDSTALLTQVRRVLWRAEANRA